VGSVARAAVAEAAREVFRKARRFRVFMGEKGKTRGPGR
jgi:hypothetical protein